MMRARISLVRDRPAHEAALRRRFVRSCLDSADAGVRLRLAGASYLYQPATGLFGHSGRIANRRSGTSDCGPFVGRLAGGRKVLPDAGADVDAGDVLHAIRADWHAEVGEHHIDLRNTRAFLEEQIRSRM